MKNLDVIVDSSSVVFVLIFVKSFCAVLLFSMSTIRVESVVGVPIYLFPLELVL